MFITITGLRADTHVILIREIVDKIESAHGRTKSENCEFDEPVKVDDALSNEKKYSNVLQRCSQFFRLEIKLSLFLLKIQPGQRIHTQSFYKKLSELLRYLISRIHAVANDFVKSLLLTLTFNLSFARTTVHDNVSLALVVIIFYYAIIRLVDINIARTVEHRGFLALIRRIILPCGFLLPTPARIVF